MPEIARQQKITFGEMRAFGVRGVLIYCSDSALTSAPIGLRPKRMREKGRSTPRATRLFRGLCLALPI